MEGNVRRLFSQRMGLEPVKSSIQNIGIDNDLRTGLWNALYLSHFRGVNPYEFDNDLYNLAHDLWLYHFKFPIDQLPENNDRFIAFMKEHINSCEWFKLFNLIEDVLLFASTERAKKFANNCNSVFKLESSKYCLINNLITPITGNEEIAAIENAHKIAPNPVRQHLTRAQQLLSDHRNSDYRNSIKESISAVESLCRQISSNPKLTLGKAIDEIKRKGIVNLHPALWEAIKNLYGWTSDEGGIRHGQTGESSVDQEDAIFMLVTCSAIVNLLTVKADKTGIELRQ